MNTVLTRGIPHPDQLDRHPELAALAILEMSLEVALNALAAVHPELWLEDEHGPLDHKLPVQVPRLLAQAARLRRAIARYQSLLDERDAQDRKKSSDNEIPF